MNLNLITDPRHVKRYQTLIEDLVKPDAVVVLLDDSPYFMELAKLFSTPPKWIAVMPLAVYNSTARLLSIFAADELSTITFVDENYCVVGFYVYPDL